MSEEVKIQLQTPKKEGNTDRDFKSIPIEMIKSNQKQPI